MTAYSLLEDYILKVKYVLLYEQVANSIPALSVKNRFLFSPPFMQKSNLTS